MDHTCDLCKHWAPEAYRDTNQHECWNELLMTNDGYECGGKLAGDSTAGCSYSQSALICGPKFGCIHWEEKPNANST